MTTSEINLVLPSLVTAVIIPLIIGIGNAIKNYVKSKTNNQTGEDIHGERRHYSGSGRSCRFVSSQKAKNG